MIHLYHHHHSLLLTILRHCAQVQLIGLQVLRSVLQKGSDEKSNSFEIFFVGEFVGDILTLIQKHFEVIPLLLYIYCLYFSNSQSPFQRFCFSNYPKFFPWQQKGGMNRESVGIVGECLKLLTLLQAVSKSSAIQKCLLNLLLEAIVMVFLVTKNHLSQVTHRMN